MATERQKKRQELREKRLQAEKGSSGDRGKMLKALAAIGFIAVVGVVVAAVAIVSGGSGDSGKSGEEINELLAGIPQEGTVLGEPGAKVTLIEYGDMLCPSCKQFANEVVPELIEGPIKNGRARIEFRQWPILGGNSPTAAFAALAAAEQGRYWQYLENFFAQDTTQFDDALLKSVAEDAGVPDIEKWERDRLNPELEDDLVKAEDEAAEFGFSGTPSFAIQKGNGQPTPVGFDGSAESLIKAINQAK
jgi:protein-disulfide isomerase